MIILLKLKKSSITLKNKPDFYTEYKMTNEYSYELKIPKDRVAVLIGTDGEIKKKIEVETKTQIKIDSKD